LSKKSNAPKNSVPQENFSSLGPPSWRKVIFFYEDRFKHTNPVPSPPLMLVGNSFRPVHLPPHIPVMTRPLQLNQTSQSPKQALAKLSVPAASSGVFFYISLFVSREYLQRWRRSSRRLWEGVFFYAVLFHLGHDHGMINFSRFCEFPGAFPSFFPPFLNGLRIRILILLNSFGINQPPHIRVGNSRVLTVLFLTFSFCPQSNPFCSTSLHLIPPGYHPLPQAKADERQVLGVERLVAFNVSFLKIAKPPFRASFGELNLPLSCSEASLF